MKRRGGFAADHGRDFITRRSSSKFRRGTAELLQLFPLARVRDSLLHPINEGWSPAPGSAFVDTVWKLCLVCLDFCVKCVVTKLTLCLVACVGAAADRGPARVRLATLTSPYGTPVYTPEVMYMYVRVCMHVCTQYTTSGVMLNEVLWYGDVLDHRLLLLNSNLISSSRWSYLGNNLWSHELIFQDLLVLCQLGAK